MLAKAKSTSPEITAAVDCAPPLKGMCTAVRSGARLEQLDRIVGEAAGAAGAVVELAGMGLGVGDELGHRLHRQVLLDDDDLRDRADDADRREVPDRIVADLLDEGCDRDGADAADAEGVAVRRRVGDGLRADDAAGARAVVDDDGLAQCRLDIARGHPADEIGVAAGRVGHDEGDGPARPRVLRVRRARGEYERQRQSCKLLHQSFSRFGYAKQILCRGLEPVELQRLGGRRARASGADAEKVTTSAKLAMDGRSARADALVCEEVVRGNDV